MDSTLADLESSGCIAVEEDFITTPTILGYIASYYYLDYRSVGLIKSSFLDMEEVDLYLYRTIHIYVYIAVCLRIHKAYLVA